MSGSRKGGFHVGTVGGNASFSAGGDMVAGDKVAQTTTTAIDTGFKQDHDKQKFLEKIEELRATLRELQAKMAETPGLSQDVKDEIAAELLQQVNVLKKAKDEAAGLPVAQQPPPEIVQVIEHGLDSTSTALDKIMNLYDKAVGFGEKVEPYVSKALPILLAARHLLGLP
jgi:hypothetical protein